MGNSPQLHQARDYNRWFADNVPYFDCSDPGFKKMWYYRWWIVRFHLVDGETSDLRGLRFYEGKLGFDNVIGFAVPAQIKELTYLRDPRFGLSQAQNSYRNRHENGAVVEDLSGMGDSSIELKWRFYDANGLSFALKPGVVLPTGDEDKGLGTGKTSWGVNFIATYEAEPWAVYGNVAYSHVSYKLPQDEVANRSDLWRVSAGAAYSMREELRLVGEAGVRTNQARDDPFLPGDTGRFAMVGLIYSPTGKIDLDIGYRKGLNDAEPDWTVLIGATFRW